MIQGLQVGVLVRVERLNAHAQYAAVPVTLVVTAYIVLLAHSGHK